jgi:FtsP/CotA-like multicopper oxidase with cupredoxin domain
MSQTPAPPVELTRPPRTEPTGIVQFVRLEATEHAWEIAPGTIVRGYGYNAQVPGPTLEATVGDTLLVRFTNSLEEATTLHWHGLRLPHSGGVAVQPSAAVPPGGTVERRLELPDAGTFWYHPHVGHTQRSDFGMYGALVVRDPVEPVVDGERVLFLGCLKPAGPAPDAPTPVPQDSDGGARDLLLVNGVREAQMLVSAGQRERWRMVNAGTGSLRLSLSGQTLRVVSSDSGLRAAPVEVDAVLLGPGERRDVVTGPFSAGQSLTLNVQPCDLGSGRSHRRRIATLHVAGPVSV